MLNETCDRFSRTACGIGSGGLSAVAIAANALKGTVGVVGSIAATVMGVDLVAYTRFDVRDFPSINHYNKCQKPLPILVNMGLLFSQDSCYGLTNKIAEEIFQNQILALPFVVGATIIGVRTLSMIEKKANEYSAHLTLKAFNF